MQKSESIGNLSSSLGEFLNLVENPRGSKEVKSKSFSYKYMTLNDILTLVRPLLHSVGLSIVQDVSAEGNEVKVSTTLLHSSGEYIESDYVRIPLVEMTAQAVGSAITYGRRYSLCALLSIAIDDDDDGSIASGKSVVIRAIDEDLNWFMEVVMPHQKAKGIGASQIYKQFSSLATGKISKEKIKELLNLEV